MIQLIRLFLSAGWNVVFASAASKTRYSARLNEMGVDEVSVNLNCPEFDDFIRELNPSVVLFDRFMTEEQFGWRVAVQCPGAIRILDTEDLHCLREGRRIALKENREYTNRDLMNDVAMREMASIYRSDLSLIISRFEMNLLTSFFNVPPELLYHLPFMTDPLDESETGKWPSFETRRDFVTIGNFLHTPNRDAVVYLKEEIWPRIRERLPGVNLHVYGAYPSEKIRRLQDSNEGFLIEGRAEDAKTVVGNARVLLAPLRFGAGLKGKLLEAMQCGTPSVTSSIGAESMHGDLPWPGEIEDDPEQFAKAAAALYQSELKWQQAQKSGIEIVNKLYQKNPAGNNLMKQIDGLMTDLKKHRLHNFTGAMLMHHSLASTKYMSKWIEEKNK